MFLAHLAARSMANPEGESEFKCAAVDEVGGAGDVGAAGTVIDLPPRTVQLFEFGLTPM
ncbi:MAG: hypothetical protein QF609_01955 [Gammaproteobacteria bacterium]|jgi:hypothetical protein|nr:hypothetical protein [Gammaproteobacteria bacterium]